MEGFRAFYDLLRAVVLFLGVFFSLTNYVVKVVSTGVTWRQSVSLIFIKKQQLFVITSAIKNILQQNFTTIEQKSEG